MKLRYATGPDALSNYTTKKFKCGEELAGSYKEMAVVLGKRNLSKFSLAWVDRCA